MRFLKIYNLFFFVMCLSFSYQALAVGPSTLNCVSTRMMTLDRAADSPHGSANIMIDNQERLYYNISPSETLHYNSVSGQFSLANQEFRHLPILRDESGEYYYLRPDETNLREPPRHMVSSGVVPIIEDLKIIGRSGIQQKINECRRIRTFREQLQQPMNALETQTCRQNLEQLNQFHFCVERRNCPEVFDRMQNSAPQNYSFVTLFESGTRMSDPQVRVGAIMAADTGISWAVPGIMLANRAAVGSAAARVGLSFTGVFGLMNALLTISTPVLMTMIDTDDCGEQGFAQDQGRNVTDCVGQNARDLQNRFQRDILRAIESPNPFFADVASRPNGQMARLACYAFEAQLQQYRQVVSGYTQVRCQGRTIDYANGEAYLIAEDGHLYRHLNIDTTLHFYPNAPTLIEHRNTGVREPAISVDQYISSLTGENRRQAAGDSTALVPQRVLDEERLLQGVYPRAQASIAGGVCLPAERAEPTSVGQ